MEEKITIYIYLMKNIMKCEKIKIKYKRNGKIKVLKIYEIGKSYGGDSILYRMYGGFCLGKEVLKICKK
jgi:hypothetical protein